MDLTMDNEPLNLLALDGGGIRGVSELVILHEIMLRIQERAQLEQLPKPCDYFHIIGGTSTGGLVAIMLGRLKMSTQEALDAYDTFSSRIFSKRNRKKTPDHGLTQRYKATKLEKTVKELVAQHSDGVKMADSRQLNERGRSFVCAKFQDEHRMTTCFRTYPVQHDQYSHIDIWEAARATTAAPLYFKPMTITNSDGLPRRFIDGAIGCNNPSERLLEEADLLYGKRRKLGCVVSLGTGDKPQELRETASGIQGTLSWGMSLALVMKEITVDCEETHARVKKKFENFPHAYFRFNVAGGAVDIKLQDWDKIGLLKERTNAYLQSDDAKTMINDLVKVLLQESPNRGLTLGHIGGLDEDCILLDTHVAIPRGRASRIFTGREAILRRMDDYFGDGDSRRYGRREFHLRGLGGVGKTQIALQFADWHDRRFLVIWIDATSPLTIEQSYKKYCEGMFPNEDPNRAVQVILHYLQRTNEEWLLVFDNAPEKGLSIYIPDGNQGNIIYTSRPHVLDLQQRLHPESIQDVYSMERDDAVLLLLRAADIDPRDEHVRYHGGLIVDELGCLPLAVDQAGAYVQMAPCPLDQFLEVYHEQKQELLRNPPFRGEDEKRNLPIYATFNISLRAIEAYTKRRRDMDKVHNAINAIQILCIICFYHNEGSIRDVFSFAAEHRDKTDRNTHFPLWIDDLCLNELVEMKGDMWKSESFDRGIRFLRDFSLIKIIDDIKFVSMHALVHEWARGRLEKGKRAQCSMVARAILFDSVSYKSTMTHVLYRRAILPHLDACEKYCEDRHESDILESEYDGKYAMVQIECCNFEQAEVALKRTIYVRQFEFSLLGRETLAAMSQLGRVYTKQGRFGDAEATLLEVINRRELALKDKKEKQREEAIKQARRDKKPEPPEHTEQLNTMLADTELNRIASDSEEWDIAALDVPSELANTPGHDIEGNDLSYDPEIHEDKIRLAGVYAAQDQLQLAKNHVAEVVEEMEMYYDARKQYTLQRARIYLNRLEEVTAGGPRNEPSSENREALAAARQLFGHTSRRTMRIMESLAQSLTAEKQFREAEALYSELYFYNKTHYGDEALETIDVVSRLALVYNMDNRAIEAATLHQTALDVREKRLGRHHPATLESMEGLAFSFAAQGRVDEGLVLLKECIEWRKAVLGANHTVTTHSQALLEQLTGWPAITPALQARLNNKLIENLRANMGEYAPEWLRNWQPEPVVIQESRVLSNKNIVHL